MQKSVTQKMTESDAAIPDNSILLRSLEYCKYLYEEEDKRTNSLNNTVKAYFTVLTFTIGLLSFKAGSLKDANLQVSKPSIDSIVLLGISLFLLFLSLILSILVLKMRKYERLTDPERVFIKAQFLKTEGDFINSMMADFSVATNRNYTMNQQKVKLLIYALIFYLAGIIFLLGSLLYINIS
jgi:hypothetical protein